MPSSILVKGYCAVCISLILAVVVITVIPRKNKISLAGELKESGNPGKCMITLEGMTEWIGDEMEISSLELTIPLADIQSDRIVMDIPNPEFSVSLRSDSVYVYLYGTRSRMLASLLSQGIVAGKVRGAFYMNGKSILNLWFPKSKQRKENQYTDKPNREPTYGAECQGIPE